MMGASATADAFFCAWKRWVDRLWPETHESGEGGAPVEQLKKEAHPLP
jgi:hypothetical protein